jgi:uncharacterized damage-inducible protein DinB
MAMTTLNELRYPTGKWVKVPILDAAGRAAMIDRIAEAPAALAAAVAGLDDVQLDTPYRTDGWSSRQIVHHLADSHMNAFARFKLGITEDNPTIKPYDEKTWAQTSDASEAPIGLSLMILEGLHARWVQFLRALDAAALDRTIQHPERGPMSLGDMMQLYAWHGRHHTVQITQLRQRQGW